MQEKVIEIKDITKTYKLYNKPSDRLRENFSLTHKSYHRDHNALQGINLDVYKGECVGIAVKGSNISRSALFYTETVGKS